MSAQRRREAVAGLLFTMPWILGFLIFYTYPILFTGYLSFTEYNILQPPKWVGLENYRRMFETDPTFWPSVKNSLYYALASVPARLCFALFLALTLNIKARGIAVYRTLFYLPTLVPPVVSTIVFLLLFQARGGLVNQGLDAIGLGTPGWLLDPSWSKPTLVIMSLWTVGVETLVFLAALKDVPTDLLDAAALDGAGPFRRFLNVTLPMLTPAVLFNLVTGVILSFQVFTQAMVMGGTTGEPVGSTLMFMVVIYLNAFRYFAMGYAAALSVVLFLAVLVITLAIFRSSRAWVYYEDGEN
jgi:multiple sugar transport system permease protein